MQERNACASIGHFANIFGVFQLTALAETFAVKEFGSADVSEFELTLLRGRCRWSQMVADGRLGRRVRSKIQAQPAFAGAVRIFLSCITFSSTYR